MLRGSFIFLLATTLMMCWGLIVSFTYRYKAMVFPVIALSFGLILSIVQILRDIRALEEREAPKAGEETMRLNREHYIIAAWIVGAGIMIWVLGFIAGVVAFCFIYLRYCKESWSVSIILPIFCAILFYFFFGKFLGMPLYPGLLFEKIVM